jgi:hypothetical protein
MPRRAGLGPATWRWALRGQLPAALLLIASLGCPMPWAIALSLPYLLMTALAALSGAWRFVQRRSVGGKAAENEGRLLGEAGLLCHAIGFDAALVYLPGGALWHMLSLLEVPILGFEPAIVRLTAVHLHYVGFALPLLTGMTLRRVEHSQARTSSPLSEFISSTLCIAALLNFPIIAGAMTLAQHTAWRGPELAAVLLLSAALSVLAIWQVRAAMAASRPAVLMLLGVSAISLATAMALAVIYAAGRYLGADWLDIPAMLPTHGMLQAVGFALCGLLAWHAENNTNPTRKLGNGV